MDNFYCRVCFSNNIEKFKFKHYGFWTKNDNWKSFLCYDCGSVSEFKIKDNDSSMIVSIIIISSAAVFLTEIFTNNQNVTLGIMPLLIALISTLFIKIFILFFSKMRNLINPNSAFLS